MLRYLTKFVYSDFALWPCVGQRSGVASDVASDDARNMQFILELSLESSSPTGGGSCEPQDLPVERYRRAPGRSLLRWLAGLGPEPECHLNHSLCPATCTSHSHGTGSAL